MTGRQRMKIKLGTDGPQKITIGIGWKESFFVRPSLPATHGIGRAARSPSSSSIYLVRRPHQPLAACITYHAVSSASDIPSLPTTAKAAPPSIRRFLTFSSPSLPFFLFHDALRCICTGLRTWRVILIPTSVDNKKTSSTPSSFCPHTVSR